MEKSRIQAIHESLSNIQVPKDNIEVLEMLSNLEESAGKDFLTKFMAAQMHSEELISPIIRMKLGAFVGNIAMTDLGQDTKTVPVVNNSGEITQMQNPSNRECNLEASSIMQEMSEGNFSKWNGLVKYIKENDGIKYSSKGTRWRGEHELEIQEIASMLDNNRIVSDEIKILKGHIEELDDNMPVPTGVVKRIQHFFEKRRVERRYRADLKQKESELLTDEEIKQKTLSMLSGINFAGLTKMQQDYIQIIQEMIKSGKISGRDLSETISYLPNGITKFDSFEQGSQLAKDVRSNIRVAQRFYSDEVLGNETFEGLVKSTRHILSSEKVYSSEGPLDEKYRFLSVPGNSNYIYGGHYSTDKIKIAMGVLEEKYQEAVQIDDLEEFIRCAADLHIELTRVHPFRDGNGRTSRMVLSAMLAQKGIVLPTIIDTHMSREEYSIAGNAAAHEDYNAFEEYLLKRVKANNPDLDIEITPREELKHKGKSMQSVIAERINKARELRTQEAENRGEDR